MDYCRDQPHSHHTLFFVLSHQGACFQLLILHRLKAVTESEVSPAVGDEEVVVVAFGSGLGVPGAGAMCTSEVMLLASKFFFDSVDRMFRFILL